ncbi:spore germination protein [Bacillus horti]|uniref:Stage V sporulation protein AF n=1 Tax=Caldalkalibacillus horti TaxID=77523 RepID=A0ABT9W4U2_9BACI|nr:spore germination protein [Bacillus horti]MDQ0168092.1 stage V sporulation protein AF [Bacillus horti]
MKKAETQVPLSTHFDENITYLQKALRVDKSFDIIHHKLEYGGRKFAMFFVDGFAKDIITQRVMQDLADLEEQDLSNNPIEFLVRTVIPYIEVETTSDLEEVIGQVLAGQAAFIVEGTDQAILLDVREYPARSPEEPDIERVVRGPRDGFVETLVFNTALIRRRIRDRSLCMEYMQVGQRSKTDIVVAYMDSIADPQLVKKIKDKLSKIVVDGLAMGEKTVEEFVFGRHLNPYPLVRYTERPDTAAIHLMEGHVLLIIDGSPSIMICPTTFWHHLQHAEEYRQKPLVGAILRWVRFVAVISSLFLLPAWYLVSTNSYLLSERWSFIGPEEIGSFSLLWQFLIAEVGIEILRMAAIHTPNALATALGLVAAILIGEVAVDVGVFSKEVILYIAIAATSTFATPSYELSLANRISRVFFLLCAALFGVWGFVLGIVLWFIYLTATKALSTPYMWPLVPFNFSALYDVLVRAPIPLKRRRPDVLHPQDETK